MNAEHATFTKEIQKLKAMINQRQSTTIFANKSNESDKITHGDAEFYINDMTKKFTFTRAGVKNPVMIDPKLKSIENVEYLNGLKVEEIITGIEDIEELQEITAEHTERIGVIEGDVAALKNRTQELETRTDELTTRSDALETRAQQLETRAQQLETRTDELDTRTGIIEIQTQELDSRTDELETQTQELDSRTGELDTHTQQLDTRTGVLE